MKAEKGCLGTVRELPDVTVIEDIKHFLLNVHVIRSWVGGLLYHYSNGDFFFPYEVAFFLLKVSFD